MGKTEDTYLFLTKIETPKNAIDQKNLKVSAITNVPKKTESVKKSRTENNTAGTGNSESWMSLKSVPVFLQPAPHSSFEKFVLGLGCVNILVSFYLAYSLIAIGKSLALALYFPVAGLFMQYYLWRRGFEELFTNKMLGLVYAILFAFLCIPLSVLYLVLFLSLVVRYQNNICNILALILGILAVCYNVIWMWGYRTQK